MEIYLACSNTAGKGNKLWEEKRSRRRNSKVPRARTRMVVGAVLHCVRCGGGVSSFLTDGAGGNQALYLKMEEAEKAGS